MLPYGIIFFLMSLNAFLNKKSTKHISLIFFLFFILFYSLRTNIGSDWSGYEYYFNNVLDNDVVERYKFEVGYWLLNYITSTIFSSYRHLVILVGIFVAILFWKSTNRYTKNIGLAMLLSLYYMFYPTLEALRQSITLFLFYYSLHYIDKDQKKYLLINVIGLLFHRTGVLPLLFFVFNKYKVSKIVIILSLVFFSILQPYISNIISFFPNFALKYNWYFHLETGQSTYFSLKLLEYLLILLFYFILSKKNLISGFERLVMNLVLLGFVLQITLGQITDIVYRVTYYTDIGIIFAYISIFDRIKGPVFKFSYIVVLILYILVRFYRIFPFDDPRFIYSV
jgi:hypothetical protein